MKGKGWGVRGWGWGMGVGGWGYTQNPNSEMLTTGLMYGTLVVYLVAAMGSSHSPQPFILYPLPSTLHPKQ